MGNDNTKTAQGKNVSQSRKTSGNIVSYERSTLQPEIHSRHSERVNSSPANPHGSSHNPMQNQDSRFGLSNTQYIPTSHYYSSNQNQKYSENVLKENAQQNTPFGKMSESQEKPKTVMDISTLLELSNKESSHVINYLKDQMIVFKNTIQEPLPNSLLVVLMKIIRKICLTDSDKDKIELLLIVCCDNLLDSLSNYILTLPTHQQDCAKEDLLFLEGNVLPFFEAIWLLIPSIVCPKLRGLLINTIYAINGLEQYHKLKFDNETRKKLKEIESAVNSRLNPNSPAETSDQECAQVPLSQNLSEEKRQNVKMGPAHAVQAQAKHLSFVSRVVFPGVIKKLDVPAHRVQGLRKNIFFIDSQEKNEGFVKEAEFLLHLAKYLLKQKYKSNDILLLTTNEAAMKTIAELKNKHKSLKDMTVGVINTLENINVPIVLIYFAVSESDHAPSIFEERQLCKVLLEAKNGIFMTGNLTALEKQSQFWKEMTGLLQQYQAVSSKLPLLCELHQMVISISDTVDFKKLKNGGCLRRCEVKLSCGHLCKRQCHFDDREHKHYKCHEPCSRKPERCSLNHVCHKLCYEKCGLCDVSIEINNSMSLCHELFNQQRMKGKKYVAQPATDNGKGSLLPCGHAASKETGHQLDLWSIELVNLCQVPCTAVLYCGHPCTGTCGSCRQGRVHMPCRDKRKITLACGHRLISTCSSPVEQCNQKCFYECPHGMCKETCGVPCTPCKEKCTFGCEHSKCTKLCFEICDISPCFEPCKKLLSCGHQCIGFCGEPCPPSPEFCRVCNPENMKKRDTSGTARFVFLVNCKHTVRSKDLDLRAFQRVQKMEALACPVCTFNITKTTRYLNYAKKLHRNLFAIRNVRKGYTDNLPSAFWKIAKEIRSLPLPSEIENHPKMEEIKKHFQPVKGKSFADHKAIILLMFLRNLLYPVVGGPKGMVSPNHLDWFLYMLLERYEMGLCSQVLRELYKEIIEFQKLKGTVYKMYLLELHKAIAFFTYLEKNTWTKCGNGHLSTYNSLLTECGMCDNIQNDK